MIVRPTASAPTMIAIRASRPERGFGFPVLPPCPSEATSVVARAAGRGEYCRSQARFSPDPSSIKHIIPPAAGGTDDLPNLALSCQGCNNHKYNKTHGRDPVTEEPAPLFHPRKQRWRDHFVGVAAGASPLGRGGNRSYSEAMP